MGWLNTWGCRRLAQPWILRRLLLRVNVVKVAFCHAFLLFRTPFGQVSESSSLLGTLIQFNELAHVAVFGFLLSSLDS